MSVEIYRRMPTFFENLIQILWEPLLSTILGMAIGYTVFLARDMIPPKIKWRLSNPQNTRFIIATSAQIDTGKYIRYTTGLGQVGAIGKLLPSYVDAYSRNHDVKIYFSETFPEANMKDDLVIIGGAKNNKITRLILKECPTLPYTQITKNDNDVIVDVRRNQEIVGQLEEKGVVADFGLVISMPNPRNPKARALVFLSVHTYGLEAAAEAFVHNIGFWQSIKTRDYACLVKCKVNGSLVGPPEILDFCPL